MARSPALLLVLLAASCHGVRGNDKPMSPIEQCRYCCQQALDACRLDSDAFPAARCPPKFRECTTACDAGDENEMCVVETNREMARRVAPAPQPKPIATASTEATTRGACDGEGTWKVNVAMARGEARGCTGVTTIPKQVSFRIERRKSDYALRDLSPAPGWSDAFTIENAADRCIVTLRRANVTDKERPRAIEVKLAGDGNTVTGTFHYEEATTPVSCALESAVIGSVVAPAPREAPEPSAGPKVKPIAPRPGKPSEPDNNRPPPP